MTEIFENLLLNKFKESFFEFDQNWKVFGRNLTVTNSMYKYIILPY